jgi:hypothetical protein
LSFLGLLLNPRHGLQRALNQNLDLAAALARVRQARAAAAGSGAALNS